MFVYVARPESRAFPHRFVDDNVDFPTWWGAYQWCTDEFGAEIEGTRWKIDHLGYHLRDADDAVAFRMRWC